MKVQILKRFVGEDGVLRGPGITVVDDGVGRRMITAGRAVEVAEKTKYVPKKDRQPAAEDTTPAAEDTEKAAPAAKPAKKK